MFKILELYPTYKPNTLPESSSLKPELQSVLSADSYKFRKFRDTIKNDLSELIFFSESYEHYQNEIVDFIWNDSK
jgi:hypothetical protein